MTYLTDSNVFDNLTKVFDSRYEGFNHHMVLFEINFEKFDSVGEGLFQSLFITKQLDVSYEKKLA